MRRIFWKVPYRASRRLLVAVEAFLFWCSIEPNAFGRGKKRQIFPEGEHHFTHPFTIKR
jgi:hypothetical protein